MDNGFHPTYNVSPLGNEAPDGLATTPFKTIKKAASIVYAGNIVLVSGKTYIEENIIPITSGTQSAMIVFKTNMDTKERSRS